MAAHTWLESGLWEEPTIKHSRVYTHRNDGPSDSGAKQSSEVPSVQVNRRGASQTRPACRAPLAQDVQSAAPSFPWHSCAFAWCDWPSSSQLGYAKVVG